MSSVSFDHCTLSITDPELLQFRFSNKQSGKSIVEKLLSIARNQLTFITVKESISNA